jgi:hypothetical protein
MSDVDLDELSEELAEFAPPERSAGRPPREERIIAGFEEIQRFVEAHGRAPQHGEDRDIFERLYAVRLDRLRARAECRLLLEPLDYQGLLAGAPVADAEPSEPIDEDELLAELQDAGGTADITELRHVASSADRRAAEEVANRQKCEDFEQFKPLFQAIQIELDAGQRQTRRYQQDADIRPHEFFVLGGQKVYVAEFGEEFLTEQGRRNARLRLIFDNGTESRGLLRSFQRALYKDEAGRRITDPVAGPLFAENVAEGDQASGTIYVLRSKSDHPLVSANRDLVHKIGVTDQDVKKRIASARLQPTFLMADVEVVATYELYNINRTRLENLIHRIFQPARLEIEVKDRFGQPVVAREWFLAPLPAIDEAVRRIKDNSIVGYAYDLASASLKPLGAKAK